MANSIPEWLQREVNDYFVEPLNIRPSTVLDIGANIGAFALRAHREWPAAHIICYEPMPFNVDQLRQNVRADWCHVVPCAVRAESGEDDIYIGDMFVTSGFRKGMRQTDRVLRVSCVAAREIASCDLVKIDTEGCEVEILANLDLTRTKAIMLEHHSRSDAATIRQILTPKFRTVHDESYREVGTMIFVLAYGSDVP
ncbi:TPA: FkbM family methyltransferase [Salmonella enterica]|uniref:FkbM family methyltransferase n=1 Tax=Salmonella enterica TaxID=28901 RepID=A0A756L923_SALER|nr:FkbM family methyltransferase [Salmonella enterica]